jgi:hypothetical protein
MYGEKCSSERKESLRGMAFAALAEQGVSLAETDTLFSKKTVDAVATALRPAVDRILHDAEQRHEERIKEEQEQRARDDWHRAVMRGELRFRPRE